MNSTGLVYLLFIVFILCIIILCVWHTGSLESELYKEPGECPVCHSELIKGYLGEFFAVRKIYYCPNCE